MLYLIALTLLYSGKCRQTLRGHSDSVNHVFFQPFTNQIWTCSGDKTMSHWDLRSGHCVQTYYGHMNAVVHGLFSLSGEKLVSCDLDGVVKIWDHRNTNELKSMAFTPAAAHKMAIDPRGNLLAIALSNGQSPMFVQLLAGSLSNSLIDTIFPPMWSSQICLDTKTACSQSQSIHMPTISSLAALTGV